MPLYAYKAINSLGETEEGVRDASDEASLIGLLQAEGYIPIKVSPASAKKFSRPESGSKTDQAESKGNRHVYQ